MADRAYVAENEVERKRLASLVARLSDQDLARPMPGGWTVASVLGHVAFWDQRIIALIEAWRKAGVGTPPKDLDGATRARREGKMGHSRPGGAR